MSNQLYNFYVDYAQSNGSYMKIRKTKEKGFQSTDLQELQLKMIQSNTIPRLVPMNFEEINGKITVMYSIDGLRKLRPLSKERPLSMQDYYSLFINIIQALQDSNNYMLEDQQYVLNEDYIYVGNGYHQVYLTYLPLNDIKNKPSLYEDLKKLLLNIAGEVQGLKGVQFKMILSYIKDPGFSLQGLKQLLSQMHEAQEEIKEESSNLESDQDEETTVIKKVKKLPPLDRKMKLYSVLFGVLALAIVWKLFGGSSITISTVLSVVVIAAVFIYWKVWRPGIEPIVTEKEVKVKKKQSTAKPVRKQKSVSDSSETETDSVHPQVDVDFNNHDDLELVKQAIAQHSESASALHVDTTTNDVSSNQRDQTMLLDEEEINTGGKSTALKNYIMVKRADGEERIDLESDNFIIGRADKGTDFVEKGIGISRLHVEFVKLSDTYGLKDLGAKNGTYINDEKIIPYKIHELKDEDQIRIGKTNYTYRVS
ncbi:hypothetical protein CFK37_12190 [Virgibacillus phasianinus]|uniref:FHA domain-containing protein n=1 Tax=Virgibacillus phasianinus TaxID=2017483 RepID=A0A220U547_9BACI|nr:DUF6382 domain-containing protein [Virgibacillus phasianinus]ASK62853.1 hypothetical protein CFK37_12190 [Virgibacillus phasianinus]